VIVSDYPNAFYLMTHRLLKLEILTFICSKDNTEDILRELQIHIKHSNPQFVCATVRAVGRVADAEPEVADRCMEGLMHLMSCNKGSAVVGESVVVLRQMLQQSSGTDTSSLVLHQLSKMLVGEQAVEEALARSSIVWLVGEFHDVLSKVAPDILRLLAVSFTSEATETKMQIMNLAIKLSLRLPDDGNVQSLMTYVLEMSRYDVDTDLRDRSRFMTALMGLAPSNESEGTGEAAPVDEEALEELAEHAMGIMLAPKLPPVTLLGTVDVEGLPNFNLGSLSSLVGHYISGYQPLCGWPDVQPNPSARDALRLTADEDGGRNALSDDRVRTTKNKRAAKSGNSSSSDSDDDSTSGKKGHDLTGFYGEKSDAESSSNSSGSSADRSKSSSSSSSDDSSSEDESSRSEGEESSEESASEAESESESESGSDSEEEAVSRIPLTQAKASGGTGAARLGMRKVVTGQKAVGRGRFDDPVDLSSMLMPSFADTTLGNQFNSLSMNSALPPGAGAATLVADDFGDDFSSLFPTSVTLDQAAPFGSETLKPMTPDFTQAVGNMQLNQKQSNSSILGAFDDNKGAVSPRQQQQQPQQQQQQQQFNFQQQLNVQHQQQQQIQQNSMGAMAYPNPGSSMQQLGNMSFSGGGQGQGMGQGVGMGMQQMGGMSNMITGGMNMNMGFNSSQAQMPGAGQGQGQMQNSRSAPPAAPEDLSAPKVILKAEMGGGLAISIVFRYSVQAVAYMGAHSAFLIAHNIKDHPIR
jgi:Adaptin N terminal region